jgi:hypothetical protein
MKGVTLHANCEYPSPTASERLIDEKIFWEKCEASKLDASFFIKSSSRSGHSVTCESTVWPTPAVQSVMTNATNEMGRRKWGDHETETRKLTACQ